MQRSAILLFCSVQESVHVSLLNSGFSVQILAQIDFCWCHERRARVALTALPAEQGQSGHLGRNFEVHLYPEAREWSLSDGSVCAQSCLALCDPVDFSPPGSFVRPGENDGMGCHFFVQGIILTQGSNLCLLRPLHWQAGSLPLSHQGSPYEWWLLYHLSGGG